MTKEMTYSKSLEVEYAFDLPKSSYAGLRVDGKNFSKFTKPLRVADPFNDIFTDRMESVAEMLCETVSGALCVFVQSDEVSVIFHDLGKEGSEKWMGGRVQKCTSLGAAYSSVAFNRGTEDMAVFDGRVFDLTDDLQVVSDYLRERYRSGVVNSVSMYASSKFSHSALMGVSTADKKLMLNEAGFDWETDVSARHKYGSLYFKREVMKETEFTLRGVPQKATTLRKVWVRETLSSDTDFMKFLEV